jgi:hypothetical protein
MRRNSRVAFLCLVVVACSSFLASVTTMAAGQEITHFMYASHGEAWKEYLHTMADARHFWFCSDAQRRI